MISNWKFKLDIDKNREFYGRVLDIDFKNLKYCFLHSDCNIIDYSKVYCVDVESSDLEWYKMNMEAQKFYNNKEEMNKESSLEGVPPAKFIRGPRLEIVTYFMERNVFLKTKAI
jgi:hypothetical protein